MRDETHPGGDQPIHPDLPRGKGDPDFYPEPGQQEYDDRLYEKLLAGHPDDADNTVR